MRQVYATWLNIWMKHLYTSGADHLTFEGGGGGMVDFRENILQTAELFWQENTSAVKKNPTLILSTKKSYQGHFVPMYWNLCGTLMYNL